jgi:DNA-3-methyladenine glycosylase
VSRLQLPFFARDARVVARELIGKYLTVENGRGGRIVEVEAYLGAQDRASHARFGADGRSRLMYGPAGVAYVFLIYGMHECFNIVTAEPEQAEAVLLRALEPLPGTARCDGPGRLTRALGIDRRLNGSSLLDGPIAVEDHGEAAPRVVTTARIGVDYAGAWAKRRLRYCEANSRALSVPLARPKQREIAPRRAFNRK